MTPSSSLRREATLREAARAVCPWCSGSFDPGYPERRVVHGPNEAGNYTHHVSPNREELCRASSIYALITWDKVTNKGSFFDDAGSPVATIERLLAATERVEVERDRYYDDLRWDRRLLRFSESRTDMPWAWWFVNGGVVVTCQHGPALIRDTDTAYRGEDERVPMIDAHGRVEMSVMWKECGCARCVRLDKYAEALAARLAAGGGEDASRETGGA